MWLTRAHVGAARRLHALNHWPFSAVTYMELAQGCRDKAELARLKKGPAAHGTEIVPVTPAVGECATDLIARLALSHGMRLADALIGATALVNMAMPITANGKHFGAIQGLDFETFAP